MRVFRAVLFMAPLIALFGAMCFPNNARGLPLFARKNALPCTTCHFAFPRLNAFGMTFRQNGYRMPGMKGESPWESKEFPLAVVGNVGYSYSSVNADTGSGSGVRVTTATGAMVQNASEFHSAGTLAEDFTFHFDANFAGIGQQLSSGQAYVQFDDLGKDGVMNVRAGVFDADIHYLASSRRTTLTDYLLPVTLAATGVEFNGTRSGWTYAAGLINSNRMFGKAGDKTLNNAENPFLWVMKDVGGSQLVGGRVYLDRQDPRLASKSASLHTQAELSAFINKERFIVVPELTYEKYSDPDLTQRDKAMSGLVEALFYLDKNLHWLLTTRYELRHMPKFDYQGAPAFAEEDDEQMVANISWYANPNAKLGLEWAHMADNVQGPRTNQINLFVNVGY